MTTMLIERVLALEAEDVGADVAAAALARLRRTVDGLPAASDPHDQARALASAVHDRLGLAFRVSGGAADFQLTTSLASGGGACLALVLVYAGLAGARGWPVRARLFEGHVCATHLGADPALDLETTRRGGVVPAALGARLDRGPGRVLDDDGLVAVYRANRAAFVLVPAGRYDDAEVALQEVIATAPDYAGARLNLAALALRRGRPADAVAQLTVLLTRPLGPRYRQRAIGLLARASRQRGSDGVLVG